MTADPDVVARADLVVLPGSRATLSDLEWMRSRGLDQAVLSRAAAGRPVLGICGGYQMLAESIDDSDGVESDSAQTVAGLGLLPIRVRFDVDKHLGRPVGQWRGNAVTAYEIHHGVAARARSTVLTRSRSWMAGNAGRCGGRPGTEPWRTTDSGGCS